MAIEPTRQNLSDRTALVLVTLTPEQESRRKRIGSRRQTCAMFERLLRHWRKLGRSIPGTDLLLCAPARTVGGETVALPQRGDGLGSILRHAVDDAFRLGYGKVLLIGNDAPGLSAEYMTAAIRRLGQAGSTAVLGPADDGGFVLLGLNRNRRAIFGGIDWGTGLVAAQTVRRLSGVGFRVVQFPSIEDLDDAPSLGRFLDGATRGASTELRAQLRRIFANSPGWRALPRLTIPIVPPRPSASLRAPPGR